MDKIDAKAAREWLATNGHPEVAGKRGRLNKALLAEYAATLVSVVEDEAKQVGEKVVVEAEKVERSVEDEIRALEAKYLS